MNSLIIVYLLRTKASLLTVDNVDKLNLMRCYFIFKVLASFHLCTVVNAEAREEVINKNLSNYTGCNDDAEKPSCGRMIFEGKLIPYSQGFCCSCDPELNIQRQISLLNESVVPPISKSFTKIKDKPITLLKSPRSVEEHFLDRLSDLEERIQNEAAENEAPLANSNNANLNHKFTFSDDNNLTLTRNSHDEETDLINLKDSHGTTKENPNWATRIHPYKKVSYQQLSRESNISQTSNKEWKSSAYAEEIQEAGNEMFLTYKLTKSRYMSPLQNPGRVNITEKLTKLEEDYKYLRMLSLMRAERRNNENDNTTTKQNLHPFAGKYSSHTMNGNDRQEHISTFYIEKLLMPTEETVYGRISTLSVDVLFAITQKKTSTPCPVHATTALLTTCPTVRTMIHTDLVAVTSALLRLKPVSDRVYPSITEMNAYKINEQQDVSHSNIIGMTMNMSQKFGTGMGDLQNNIVVSENFNNAQSDSRQARHTAYNATSSENVMSTLLISIKTESTLPSEEIMEKLHTQQIFDSNQSFSKILSQVESPANSSSNFSSGNHWKDDAILLSGSLKNQLENGFSFDKRKKCGWEVKRKMSSKDVIEKSGIGYNGEVGHFQLEIPTQVVDDLVNRHRFKDQLTSTIGVRKSKQINLEPTHSYESSYSISNGKFVSEMRNSNRKVSGKIFIDYSNSKEMDIPLLKKSVRLNVPRSYRSIADDISFSNRDTDQRRNIHKKIKDKFVDISEALKDAADIPKIIRGRPNNESIFEIDNLVIKKLDFIVNEVPGSSSMIENHLQVKDGVSEGFVDTEILQSTGHLILVDRLNPKKTSEGTKIIEQDLARGSRIEAYNTKSCKFLSLFSDEVMGQSSRYNNYFRVNEEVSRSTPALESYGSKAQLIIVKHTEGFTEPVSEIPQPTGHKIIVDQFKIVNNFQELLENYKPTMMEKIPTDPTYVSQKMQDLKKKKHMARIPLHWTSIHNNERNTKPVFETSLQTLGQKIILDRTNLAERLQELTDDIPLRSNVLIRSSFSNVFPKIGHLKEEMFSIGSHVEPIAIAMFDNTQSVKNDTILHSKVSPLLIIENLKKELRKEVNPYISVSISPLQNATSNFRGVQGHSNVIEEVREANSELTSAEKVEDLVTDEEPLPPDEETKYTTMNRTKSIIMRSTVSSNSISELRKMNGALLPRLAFQDFETSFLNKTYARPLKRMNKMLIVLEESMQSSSMPSLHLGNKKTHKKRRHRQHHYQRISHNKKRSLETKLNIIRNIRPTMSNGYAVLNEKNENENDEHHWYGTTIKTGTGNTKISGSEVMIEPITRIYTIKPVLKTLKRRKLPMDSINLSLNHQRHNGSSNRAKPTFSSGKLYVSLSRIPECDHHARSAGLRVEEIPKVQFKKKSEFQMNVNVEEVTSVKSTLIEVDELPIFKSTEPPISGNEFVSRTLITVGKKSLAFIRKIRNAKRIVKMNLKTQSTPKFRSFYLKSNEISWISDTVVDCVTGSEHVRKKNKRDDLMNSDESDSETLIFYDYNSFVTGQVVPITQTGNYKKKNSLESFDFENKNIHAFRKKFKSAVRVSRSSKHQLLAKRNNSVTQNNYFKSKLNTEDFEKNSKLHEIITAARPALLATKVRRSGNMVSNQFRIEPSSGWKEKMELLKLKKHADVLKEYLNWRYDIVQPELHDISGYTTKIRMTNQRHEGTTDTITAHNFNVINEKTSPNYFVTYSSVTHEVLKTSHNQKSLTTKMSSNNDDGITNETEITSSSESLAISSATNHIENDSFNKANTTDKLVTSTGFLHYEAEEKAHYDHDASTGRILPPCFPKVNNAATTYPTELHRNVDRLLSPAHLSELLETSPEMVSDHREQLSDVDNDLIIISVMEKNLLSNKNVRKIKRGETTLPKMYWPREDGVPDPISRYHRNKSKNKMKYAVSEISKKDRLNRRARRHLMSVEGLAHKANNGEYDMMVDNSEDNINAESFIDGDINAFRDDQDGQKLNNKWNQLIDKIIGTNFSEFWNLSNSTESPLPEPTGDNPLAMKQVHFTNSDKYIKQMTKNIADNSNTRDTKHETSVFGNKKRTKKHIVMGRKLESYPSLVKRRKTKKFSTNDEDDLARYESFTGDKRSASTLSLKIEDSHGFLAWRHSAAPRNTDSKVTFYQQTFDQDQSGRDFAISLSGKIHVEGGLNGQPMSISFDTSPEISNRNETMEDESNGNSDIDNSTNIGMGPSPKLLSSLFNIASDPKHVAHHTQETDDNFNSSISIRQSANNATNWRPSRENHQKMLDSDKKFASIRKSRATDQEAAVRIPKYHAHRSFSLEDSHDLEDIAEASDAEDYSESAFADNNDFEHADADGSQLFSPVQRNQNWRRSSDIDRDIIRQRHNGYSPGVKIIRIIPLGVQKLSPLFSSSDSRHGDWQDDKKGDTKTSTITAFQLPKMENDLAPAVIVKPGKIMPAEIPWQENESADNMSHVQNISTSQQDSKASGLRSPTLESAGGSLEKDYFIIPPFHRRVSTSNPISLKVIGLVSMEQPLINETKNPDENINGSYEVVPLIHVIFEQQPNDTGNFERNYNFPVLPDNHVINIPSGHMEGCPKIEMTKSLQHFHGGDSCSYSNMNNGADETEDDVKFDWPKVATMKNNKQDSKDPIGIESFPQSKYMNGPIIPNFADDNMFERISPIEESQSYGHYRERSTTLKINCDDIRRGPSTTERIRLKNMLAIIEFMTKIKEIISGDEVRDMIDTDSSSALINAPRVIVLPITGANKISRRPVELDGATDRIVIIGEGTNHESQHNEVTSDRKQSKIKQCNDTASFLNTWCKLDETRSNKSDWKAAAKDADKSFLFYGNNEKIGSIKQAASKNFKYRNVPSIASGQEYVTDRPNEGFDKRKPPEDLKKVHQPNIRVFTKLKNANNIVIPEADISITQTSPHSSGVNPNHLRNSNEILEVHSDQATESKEMDVLQNVQSKTNDRVRGLKKDNLLSPDLNLSNSKKDRTVVDNDFLSIPKIKRRRLRLNRLSYGLHDPRRQTYRSRFLPTDRESTWFRNQKFRRLVTGKAIPNRNRKIKTKTKKKKSRPKKKKHNKIKEMNHRDTEIKGKAWWPFGRQLMSLSKELKLDLDMKLNQDQIRGIKIDGNRNPRIPVSYDGMKRRRVRHRAKFPHGKKEKIKKRRKHKIVNTKKKKKRELKIMQLRSKRQIRPGGTQVRGGQDCMDRRHPSNVNPANYFESAHCLRFSDLWYSVYELGSPIMEHTVYLQLFEKHNRADGTAYWKDLTQGSMVKMGTFTAHQRDSTPTIVFTYTGAKTETQDRTLNLDPSRERLLIPSPVPIKKASDYPEVRGGSGEYLVVKASVISKDGSECDKAGVGFAAFSKQQDRCGRTKGSCLKNQPLAYWRHDMEARESGKPGCYFLSNFASVPTKPIKYNLSGSGNREYLGLEYHSAHMSAIDIEVRTDYNAIVRVGSSGRLTEVYIDSTALEHTVVTVVISNMGLASSLYQPRIADCPTELPVSWTNAKGIMQIIPPQYDQRITLDLYGQLLLNGFHCSVEVVNHRGELVAMRRIRVEKMDRCFCVWHCLCACIGSVSGMGCRPMSPEHYHAAGFQGPVPVVTTETSILMNAVKNVLLLSALLVLLLLFLGMMKWLVGMFAPTVSRWGLDSLLEGSRIEEYLEPDLRCRCLMTDSDGWPVHPDTGQRTVRVCSRKLEFVLNFIFFVTYPIAVCCTCYKKSLNTSRRRLCCPDESKTCLINEKGSSPKMICVNTYGDNRNSKLEAEDTRYVMYELQRSQESLKKPKRTKKKDRNKNGPINLTKKLSYNKSTLDVSAKRLVDDLLKNRIVFRNLTEPIGGLTIPSGTTFSLRGYFLNAENGGYRFITPCPFKQHWLIVDNQKKASKPPGTYPSNLFMRSFITARDVYESNELSLNPKGICINVQYQEYT